MAYRKLPRELRNKITEYFEHRFQGKFFDEDHILGELSEKLKEVSNTFDKWIMNMIHSYFRHFSNSFSYCLIHYL